MEFTGIHKYYTPEHSGTELSKNRSLNYLFLFFPTPVIYVLSHQRVYACNVACCMLSNTLLSHKCSLNGFLSQRLPNADEECRNRSTTIVFTCGRVTFTRCFLFMFVKYSYGSTY